MTAILPVSADAHKILNITARQGGISRSPRKPSKNASPSAQPDCQNKKSLMSCRSQNPAYTGSSPEKLIHNWMSKLIPSPFLPPPPALFSLSHQNPAQILTVSLSYPKFKLRKIPYCFYPNNKGGKQLWIALYGPSWSRQYFLEKEVSTMANQVANADAKRQAIVEKMWLQHYNNMLLAQGLITREQHRQMQLKILHRKT